VIINKKLIVLILVIALGAFFWIYFSNSRIAENNNENVFFFSCSDGVEIKISYEKDTESAILLIEEEEYTVNRVISASGARYANNNETIIFWEHQGEVMVEINGEKIYQDCRLKD